MNIFFKYDYNFGDNFFNNQGENISSQKSFFVRVGLSQKNQFVQND